MGGQWSSLYKKKDICSKQLEDTRANLIGKLQTSRYKIFRTIENAQVNQEELLVTGNMKQHKKYIQ